MKVEQETDVDNNATYYVLEYASVPGLQSKSFRAPIDSSWFRGAIATSQHTEVSSIG